MIDGSNTNEMGNRNAEDNDAERTRLRPSRRGFVRATGAGVGAALLGSTATATTTTTGDDLPRLEVDGNLIVTENGEQVSLRGLGIIDPREAATSQGREKTANDIIDMVTDEDDGWYPDVIRIAIEPSSIGNETEPVAFTEDELETYLNSRVDPVVERCAEAGVYAIIDFNREEIQWGDDDAGTIDETVQEEALTFWETVAPRYAEDDHVIYELYSEPGEPGMWGTIDEGWVQDIWELYLEFAQPIVDAIRDHTDTLVLVGSPSISQSPDGALIEPVTGENLAYTYHIYPGHQASQEQDWDGASGVNRVYEEYPLFVTEFGWRDYDNEYVGGTTSEFGEAFVEWLESHEAIHWTAWAADKWSEPAMFAEADTVFGPEWRLLGRDAGSLEDSGEYLRRALEEEGVPENYWETAEEPKSESDDEDEDAADDEPGEDASDTDDTEDTSDSDDGTGADESVDETDTTTEDDGTDGASDLVDSVPGFGVASTAAGVAGGLGYALRERLEDDAE